MSVSKKSVLSCNSKLLTFSVINRCNKLITKLAKERLQPQPEGTYEVNVNSENVIASWLISEAI
jgi:hypothetical protein